ncbi:amino acid permease [Paraclostridium bifermentans]|uniref:amino acid permease n=1 Tax=Paraclostridium bifermentans TaxID=1490 RepID=UPI00359C8AA3
MNKGKKMSLFGFFTFTSAMVMSVYVYPTFATAGFSLVFFLILSGILWFIPTALCSAEMASVKGWEEGGIFTWIGNTLGEKWGFVSIFFQWFQVTIGFIPMLFFITGMLSFVFNESSINNNPGIKLVIMLSIFWGLTFLQFKGTELTVRLAKIGFIFGIVLPIIFLIILSGLYVLSGNKINIEISKSTMFPDFTDINSLVVFVSFILAYVGIEASATHINEIENPKRNYPLAIIMLCVVSIILNMIAGLSIAIVVPKEDLNLSTGVIQSFEILINHFFKDSRWLLVVIALILPLSTMAKISTWIVGPSEGIYLASEKGIIPKAFKETNKHNVPVNLVIAQGVIVSIWCFVLTFFTKGSNLSFFLSVSLTVLIYLMAYTIFFIAYYVLLFKNKNLERSYHIKGGDKVKFIVASIGFIATVGALIVSFFPPTQFSPSDKKTYESILFSSFIITFIIPFVIYKFKK